MPRPRKATASAPARSLEATLWEAALYDAIVQNDAAVLEMGAPPDHEARAVELVLAQAELFAAAGAR